MYYTYILDLFSVNLCGERKAKIEFFLHIAVYFFQVLFWKTLFPHWLASLPIWKGNGLDGVALFLDSLLLQAQAHPSIHTSLHVTVSAYWILKTLTVIPQSHSYL
jgi:hypothetical protein